MATKQSNKEKIRAICDKCKQTTNHTITDEKNISEYDDENGIGTTEKRQIIKCCGCNNFSFRQTYFCDDDLDMNTQDAFGRVDDPTIVKLYPHRTLQTIKGVDLWNTPNILKKIHKEIISAYNQKSYILTGIGIRALLEGICKEEKISGKTLEVKINALVQNGIITKNIGHTLHNLRDLGNEVTHELKELDLFEIKYMIEIIENILENLYELSYKSEKVIHNKRCREEN